MTSADILARWFCCVLNQAGAIRVDRHQKAAPEPCLKSLAPYGEDLVVGVDRLFTWDLAG